jgi:hypothetical protein
VSAPASAHPRERLGPPDFVLLACCGAGVLALVALGALWVPEVAKMYADFGGSLPHLTRLILSRTWLLGCILVIAAAALGGALVPVRRARLALLVAALTVAVLAVAAVLVGAHLPIFQLSAAVRAD